MENNDQLALERTLTRSLHLIGIPADIQGYCYVMEAIKIAIADKRAVMEVTKKIYEPVAKQFNVTARQVSRGITRAVEFAWDRGDQDTRQDYFGYSVSNTAGKPTASEFIAIVSDRIRLGLDG